MSDTSLATILIAEDNDVSRDMMTAILSNAGYHIIPARNGEEAILHVTEIDQTPIDLALVDINMVPKGGFEFVKYMVAHEIKIPSVIITGDDSSDILTESSALGVEQVYQKPIEPERLLQVVVRILERFRTPGNHVL